MPDQVHISKFDESYIRIQADRSILMELSDRFSFTVPNANFLTSVKNKYWDGKIRLLNLRSGKLYLGLHTHVKDFCEKNGYECIYDDPIDVENPFSVDEFKRMAAALKLSTMTEEGRVDITPHDYQERAVIHAIQDGRTLLLSPTACHAPGTMVVMFDGSYKAVEDIVIGDTLLGPDGAPRKVLRLHQGYDDMFRIVPKSGEPFVVNSQHILSLRKTNEGTKRHSYGPGGTIRNIRLVDYLHTCKYFKHTHKLYHSDVLSLPSSGDPLVVEPYFLGLLLGDGSLLTQPGITTMDKEIIAEIYRQSDIFGTTVRVNLKANNQADTFLFTGSASEASTHTNWLTHNLRIIGVFGCGSDTKHIPYRYRMASCNDRLQLLAGLVDTDGSLSNGTAYDYVTKSERLADDVAFLARSLGFAVSSALKYVNGTSYYRLCISGSIERIPVRLQRKRKLITTRKNPLVSGFDVIPLGIGKYHGFELDGDHLYLLKDFTVTHNSGKSLMIYILLRYYLATTKGKALIIVPTTNLVQQMYDDFDDYSAKINWSVPDNCHMIFDGSDKYTDKRVVISTWQALAVKERLPKEILDELREQGKTEAQIKAITKKYNKTAPYVLDEEYFTEFDTVFGDECHLFASEDQQGGGELIEIMSKLCNAKNRVGTTGTLRDSNVHHLILEGIFGEVYQTTTTKQMMDDKKAAQLFIKCLQLQYVEEERKAMRKKTYQEEMEFLIGHKPRNQFIRNLALSLHGNTLVLFERVEKHGKILHQMLLEKVAEGRKLFFVHGATPAEDRNLVRKITEGETDAIIVASYGTFSTGVNIRNIDNLIFASPTKAKVRVLQSIGRGLRLSARKTRVTLFDIADDLSCWNKAGTEVRDNYSLQHLIERVNYYNTEQFDYKMYKIQLEANECVIPLAT